MVFFEVAYCRHFLCLKKKTVVYAVNSSNRIFHNSTSESVITFGKKTFRRISINEETSTQEGKEHNLSTSSVVIDPVRVLSIRSDPIRSIRSDPI